jgi:lipoate-protein ligase A
MHVRLLDMGMVNVLRSQSIYHAVASNMKDGNDPAILILRPEASYVSVAHIEDIEKSDVDLRRCLSENIPVLQREIASGSFWHHPNQLFSFFIFSETHCRDFSFSESVDGKIEKLAQAVVLAFNKLGVAVQFLKNGSLQAGSNEIGMVSLGKLENTFSFFCCMNLDELNYPNPAVFKNQSLKTPLISVKEVLGKVPSLEGSAEALLSSFEEFFNIALIPSMPTPEEMDSIYDWDDRLANDERFNSQKVSVPFN